MGTLTTNRPNSKEFLTEILEEEQWWRTLELLVKFLKSKGVEEVQIKFGFILDRDLNGEPPPGSRIVSLTELESEIRRGLDEGTIEWGRHVGLYF